ncbi:MAG: ATP-binding cassette domain-containing protein, partial [Nitrospinota bacterium]
MTGMEPCIAIEQVEKVYRTARRENIHALAPDSLEVGVGEFVSVVGPRGCGKSTLLKLLGG